MTASHLVARLQLALNGDEDLDHLHDARAKIVAALQFVDLVLETGFETGDIGFELAFEDFHILHYLVVGYDDLRHLANGVLGKDLFGQFGAVIQAFRAADCLAIN